MGTRQKKWGMVLILSLTVLLIGLPANAGSNKKIKIGAIGTMKLMAGEHLWMGVLLASEEINRAGGVRVGKEKYGIEPVKVDDNCAFSVSDAVSAIERAITIDKVDFLIGGQRSEAVLAQQEVMAAYKKIYLNAGSGSLEMSKRIAKNYDKYKYWFRAGMFNGQYTGGMIFANVNLIAGKIRKELGISKPKVAVIAEKVMWPDAIINAAKAKLPKLGMEYVGAWRPSPTSTDTSAELMGIKKAGAHIIWTVGGGPVDSVWSKQYGELQIPAAMVGMGTDSGRREFWKTSNGYCNYLVLASYIARLPGQPMYDNFLKRFGTDPVFHALTYDCVYILKNAIERAGTLESDAVVHELEKTDYQSFRGRIAFHPKGHPLPHDLIWGPDYATGFGLQWQDGKLVTVWPDGKSVLGDDRWKGIKSPETVEYKLPPRMIKYWKSKK